MTLDVNGEATNYSDMRGDLNASDGHEGDMTVVAINLLRGQAIAENRPDGGDPDTVILPLAEAMTAESLGDPGAMIERVIQTCVK